MNSNLNYTGRLIILLFIFTTFSCKRWGQGSAEGTVYDSVTNQPASGVTVTVRRSFHGNQAPFIAQTLTDANGHFIVRYYHKPPFTGYRYSVCTFLGFGSGIGDEKDIDEKITTGLVLQKR